MRSSKKRLHSKSQAEIITAAHGFRSGGFAVDTIVQDWFFWSNTPVDSSLTSYTNYGFDPSRYPSPPNLTKQLHDMHVHFMVTYWPAVNGQLAQQLLAANATMVPFVPPARPSRTHSVTPDMYNPVARRDYYAFANATKYRIGVDWSWLDSCDGSPVDCSCTLGNSSDQALTFGLMEVKAIHDGFVRDWGGSRRMFALPRSSFAGMQRTGASMWSGDISGTWDSLRRSVSHHDAAELHSSAGGSDIVVDRSPARSTTSSPATRSGAWTRAATFTRSTS